MPPVEIRSPPLRPQIEVVGRKLKQSVRVVFRGRERILRQPFEPAADVAAPGQAQRMAAAAGRRLDQIQKETSKPLSARPRAISALRIKCSIPKTLWQ